MNPTSNCSTGPCGESCVSAPCNAPSRDMPCAVGSGPQGAHTQSELNLFTTIVDSYDVSYINGLNVPMEINPTNGAIDTSNPYVCGNPGATSSVSGLKGCTYQFDTTININGMMTNYAPYLRYVTNGGATCSPSTNDPDPTCSNGEVCGLSLSEDFTTLATTCGTQIGWWNADAICSTVPSFNGGPFDCTASAGADTFANLYGCAGVYASDCYNPNSNSMCCGCPIWQGVTLPTCATGTTSCCYNFNTTWQDQAQPWAQFMKDACTTAYSFPDDDASSSFSCPQNNPSSPDVNTTNYEVIFCPGGETGI